jgi:hypothetical protein
MKNASLDFEAVKTVVEPFFYDMLSQHPDFGKTTIEVVFHAGVPTQIRTNNEISNLLRSEK